MRTLLQLDQLDPAIVKEVLDNCSYQGPLNAELSTVEMEELDESIGLIDQITTANRTVKSLEAL